MHKSCKYISMRFVLRFTGAFPSGSVAHGRQAGGIPDDEASACEVERREFGAAIRANRRDKQGLGRKTNLDGKLDAGGLGQLGVGGGRVSIHGKLGAEVFVDAAILVDLRLGDDDTVTFKHYGALIGGFDRPAKGITHDAFDGESGRRWKGPGYAPDEQEGKGEPPSAQCMAAKGKEEVQGGKGG
jgi:hypothetical protein